MEDNDIRNSLEIELRRYMLGELSESEQERFEEQLLSQDELFRDVGQLADLVRDELVEDYLAGSLTDDQRLAFERLQLASPKIQGMRLVQEALHERARRESTWRARLAHWFQPVINRAPALAAGLALLLVVGSIGAVYQLGRLNRQLDSANTRSAALVSTVESLRREKEAVSKGLESAIQAVQTRPSAGMTGIASFVLLPGLQRSSGSTTRVSLSSGQYLLELKLDIGLEEYKSYQAALSSAGGDQILEQQHLPIVKAADHVYAVMQVPRLILRGNDYEITLRGAGDNGRAVLIDRYNFRLILK